MEPREIHQREKDSPAGEMAVGGWLSNLSGLKIDTECDNAFRDCPDSLWNCYQKLVEGVMGNPTSSAIVFQCHFHPPGVNIRGTDTSDILR